MRGPLGEAGHGNPGRAGRRAFSVARSFRAVCIVTIEACDPAPVHHALHEIVSLHPVLVRGAVGKIRKVGLAQCVVFELPEILQLSPT